MEQVFIVDKTYDKQNFTETPLKKGEYENCSFTGCDFSNTGLSDVYFVDCSFTGCNLSLATLNKTSFRDVKFKDCKMLGLRFDQCNEFGLSFGFDGCVLNHSSFYQVRAKKTVFKNCQLQEADFTQCDLTEAVFDNCELSGAMFDNTILEKADLRTSYNYIINPETNRIRKAKFSLQGVAGLLYEYGIEIEGVS
jgi:uncharacterized protein YjbI with pentapeptide repeats